MADEQHVVETSEIEPPPEAPEIDLKLALPPQNVIGVLLLSTIVILSAIGMFGGTRGSERQTGTALELAADYPTRFRYKEISYLRVLVTNRSDSLVDTLTVSFDSTYMDGFSQQRFTPAATKPWEVELLAVEPGEARRIEVEIQAESYGSHAGEISAYFAGSDTTSLRVGTFTFP